MPTRRAPTRPGPDVTATAVRSCPDMPASCRARSTMGVTVSRWARLANSGTTPPKAAWRSIWLATTDERTENVSSTTAAAVSSHDVSMASTVRLTGLPRGRPRWRPGSSVPCALDGRFRPADVHQRRGHVVQLSAVDHQVDRGAEGGRHGVGRTRRGCAVRVGARDDEHAGLLQERPQEVVIGDAHGHLHPPAQPGRPVELGREAEGQGQRSGPPAAGQRLGSRRECHTERAHLLHRGGQNGKVHALGPALHAVDGFHRVGVGRSRRQSVHSVGRDNGDAAAT